MKTLIELYDDKMILNLATSFQIAPEKVVFLYEENQKDLIGNRMLESLIDAEIIYEEYAIADIEEILTELDQNQLYVDVHGGNGLAIAVISHLKSEEGLTLCYPDFTNDTFYTMKDNTVAMEPLKLPPLTVRQLFELYGAKVRDLPEPVFDEHGRKAVGECLNLRRTLDSRWTSFTKTMSTLIAKNREASVFRADRKIYDAYHDIFEQLPHVFDSCEPKNDKVWLTFHDTAYHILVTDSGVPFEYDTYYQLADSGAFDDVDLRVNVDWNGGEFVSGDPNSELDVVASLDCRLISVSCKSGKYDQQAIYEVKANADRFGGEWTIPVLCVDLALKKPEYVDKAAEIGVLLIEYEDMRQRRAAQMILDWIKKQK